MNTPSGTQARRLAALVQDLAASGGDIVRAGPHPAPAGELAKLSGGLAHDLNNVLAMIQACTLNLSDYLGGMGLHASEMVDVSRQLEQTLAAVDSGAELIRRLQRLSCPGPWSPREVDPHQLANDCQPMLRWAADAEASVRVEPRPDGLGRVMVDTSHFERVLINLVTNASQAMNGRGRISIQLDNRDPDQSLQTADLEAPPSPRHVQLSVSDDGRGISAAALQRVFEPGFTTRAQGSGLGLSTVAALVQENGGSVTAESAPNVGSTFYVYLPRCDLPQG